MMFFNKRFKVHVLFAVVQLKLSVITYSFCLVVLEKAKQTKTIHGHATCNKAKLEYCIQLCFLSLVLAHGPGLRMRLKGDHISCDSNPHNLSSKMDDKHSNIAEVADEFRMLRSNPPTQGASDCQWQIKGFFSGIPY